MRISDWSSDVCSSDLAKGRKSKKECNLSNAFVAIPVGNRSNAEAVRVPKTAELVARQIRNAIIRGELVDGDTLPAESHLIAEFEVSRPTIREAVRILESEGLVTVARGARGGARVSSPNYEMVARAAGKIGRAHVCTPVTNAHLVCRPLLDKNKTQ